MDESLESSDFTNTARRKPEYILVQAIPIAHESNQPLLDKLLHADGHRAWRGIA